MIKNTLVKQLTNNCNFKASYSNVGDKLIQLTSTADKPENMLQSHPAQENDTGAGTADGENNIVFIRRERLRYEKWGSLCIFNLQQNNDDLRKFRGLCINQLGLLKHELLLDV